MNVGGDKINVGFSWGGSIFETHGLKINFVKVHFRWGF